jgi:Zn-dependent M28 family amino/carboxypeptidase
VSFSESAVHGAICPTFGADRGRTATVRGAPLTGAGADNGDGDASAGQNDPGPPGSAAIEAQFEGFYADRGLAFEPTPFDGRSDYGPFIDVGIPAGGLFTGAEGIKTAAQRDIYGGIIGQQYDPCHHAACDTFSNNSNEVLDLNADAIAFATLTYAMDTSSVNGGAGAAA